MRNSSRAALHSIVLVAALAGLHASRAAADTPVLWEATSGLFPDQIDLPYDLFDTAAPEDPVLSPTHLTLSTSIDSEIMGYEQLEPQVSIPDPLVIEARLRVLSGSGAIPATAPVDVIFTLTPEFGNGLRIHVDEIFLLLDNNVKGPSAVVDTNDAFHTYRMEVDGAGNISVYYDNVLTLTGSAFTSAPANGPTPRVAWGLASAFAHGTTEWEFVEHNAGPPIETVPALGEPGLVLVSLLMVTTAWLMEARRSTVRVRSPCRGQRRNA